ncbi:MAG: hypothetical protein CK552_03275 [Actinobacteria bacterium]|nr:MAG: hypothetical protein CK552_03275 [Actinomycetota bacterium]
MGVAFMSEMDFEFDKNLEQKTPQYYDDLQFGNRNRPRERDDVYYANRPNQSEMRKQTLRENYLAARESGNADAIFTAASVDLRDQSTVTEEEIPEPKKKSLMSRIGGGIGKFFSGIGQRIGKFFSGGTSPRAEEADSTPQPEIGGWSEDIDYDDLDRQGKNRPEGPAMNPEGHQQLSKLGMSHDMWKNWDPQADDEEKQY